MLSTANDLKYIRQIKTEIAKEFKDPSAEFVKFFTAKVYSKKLMPSVIEQFTSITKKGMALFIKESINERLKSVISEPEETTAVAPNDDQENEIVTDENNNGIIINTQGYTKHDVLKLIEVLIEKYHLIAKIRSQKEGYQIYISGKSYEIFKNLVSSHIEP